MTDPARPRLLTDPLNGPDGPTDHPQVLLDDPEDPGAGTVAVDAGIAELLAALWRRGYRTWASCQGGPPEGEDAYIAFDHGPAAVRSVQAVLSADVLSAMAVDDDGACIRFAPELAGRLLAAIGGPR